MRNRKYDFHSILKKKTTLPKIFNTPNFKIATNNNNNNNNNKQQYNNI